MHWSIAAAALLAAGASAIPTITTKGSKFFTSDGNQFFVKGVAYQRSEADPLLDTAQCQLDASLMKTLGANAIRVYHVSSGNHDGCMQAFSDAGIYLFVDLDTFSTYILEDTPAWTESQRSAYEAVMDTFQAYDNTAGFFIGNEVITDPFHSVAAPFIKAAVRDLKAYRESKGYRNIPIGYSHADIAQLRPQLQNYLACGSDDSASVEFFGLNSYEWCSPSSFNNSGYAALTDQIRDYPVPIFMSETGCNKPIPRDFADQFSIFGPDMDAYWSGAIIYEWIQETNAYGLITYGGDTQAVSQDQGPTSPIRSGTPTPITPDFSNLMSVWSRVTPSSVAVNAYSPSLTAPPCPGYTPPSASGGWQVNGDVALPSVGETLDASYSSAITAGATGPTSTSAGPASTSTGGAGAGVINHRMGSVSSSLVSVLLGFLWWL